MHEIKCRCNKSEQELRAASTALRCIYSGAVETRKATTPVVYPYLSIVDSTALADMAALAVDKKLESSWGDYHIPGVEGIYAVPVLIKF